jgi:hypothetical protein
MKSGLLKRQNVLVQRIKLNNFKCAFWSQISGVRYVNCTQFLFSDPLEVSVMESSLGKENSEEEKSV